MSAPRWRREDGDQYLAQDEEEWLAPVRQFAIDEMMVLIRKDLAELGIEMDAFSSERALVENGAVQAAIEKLQQDGHLYHGVLEPPKGMEPDDWEPAQLLFRATASATIQTGHCRNRMVDGLIFPLTSRIIWTSERTGGKLINVFGVDHGGYVKRMMALSRHCQE